MKKIVNGQRYSFLIVREGDMFFIKATCLTSGLYSCINNLNPILSKFNVSLDNFKYYDSSWETKYAKRFYKTATGFLANDTFRGYLENKLDEDRDCSEWDNS